MQSDQRAFENDLVSQLVSMSLMLYSIPNECITRVQAIVAFPGLGELWRIVEPINLFQDTSNNAKYLLMAGGHNPTEKSLQDFSINGLSQSPFCLKMSDNVFTTGECTSTPDQCTWALNHIQQKRIASIALCAPPYHLLRAYLTMLKTALKSGNAPPVIIPAPTHIAPSQLIPEYNMSAFEMVPGEVKRILEYQKKGDVATFEELVEYLKWLWSQTIAPLPQTHP